MLLKSIVPIVFSTLLFTACDDGAYVNFYDKNHTKIDCLSYTPASNKGIDGELSKLYNFDNECKYRLKLEHTAGIVCNSSFNAAKKTTTNFPNSYIRLEVKDGFKTYYSYYKDLTSAPNNSDLKRAFDRLKEDLLNK